MGDDDPVETFDAGSFQPRRDLLDRGSGPCLHQGGLLTRYNEGRGQPLESVHLRVDDDGFAGHVVRSQLALSAHGSFQKALCRIDRQP